MPYSWKNMLLYFGMPQIVPRLAGFGMDQALNKTLIDLIGRPIALKVDWGKGN